MKSHFFWRNYLGYVALLFIGTFLFTALLLNRLHQNQITLIENNLKAQTRLLVLSLAGPLQNRDYEIVRESVRVYADASGSRFTAIDIDGVVIADSHQNPLIMDNHLRRPEIQTAMLRGEGQAQRYSDTLQEDMWYYSLPVYADDELLGAMRVAKAYSELILGIETQQNSILTYALFVFFAGVVLAFYLALRQSTAIEKITSLAEVISKGDFDQRVSENNMVGLKKLASVVNQLARNSADRMSVITADRNRLATIFAGMVEGVIDVDQDQHIIHVNDAAAKLLNVSALACVKKPVWSAIRSHEIVEALDQAIKTQTVIKTQMVIMSNHSDRMGEMIVDIYAASLSNEAGSEEGAVVVLHDVTELKKLERVRTDFVANASHELKTPITAIRGLSETILSDDQAEKSTVLQFMDRVHRQSLRLSQLVDDLLTISRLESGQNKQNFDLVNIKELVLYSIQQADMVLKEKSLTLATHISDKSQEVFGDRQNLAQLVDNLIDNAIKYTPEQGELTISLRSEGGDVVLDVSDTGIGISPQAQQRIFERFYRVDKVRSQSLGGTGLGLSIVKNIAEKHGGAVTVHSYPGRGSTFTFRMPLSLRIS